VLIAYDRDEPGEKAAAKLAKKLMAAGTSSVGGVQFPKGMDANEIRVEGHTGQ
jgi:DNA primase